MEHQLSLPTSDWLVCNHLTSSQKDLKAIQDFNVPHFDTGGGLEYYLKQEAIQDEQNNRMRTYLVRHKETDDCVGYFSLKAGLISAHEKILPDMTTIFETIPGVELANFAVNWHVRRKMSHFGLGGIIFRKLIVPFVLDHAKTLGIYLIYLFALPYPKLIATYEKYGFQRLPDMAEKELHRRIKPVYDKSCIFMFQTLEQLKG